MNELRLRLLEAIEMHNGQYGWYQLDRSLSSAGVLVQENLLHVLRELETNGFIESIVDDRSQDPRYSITASGKDAITRCVD